MPTYDYKCQTCGFHDELVLPIADRDVPCQTKCPHCGEETIERLPGAPGIGYTFGGPKTPDTFKDVLRNIKSKVGKRANINV